MNKNHLILIAVLVIGIVLVSGCLGSSKTEASGTSSKATSSGASGICAKITTNSTQLMCMAIEKNDASICNQIQGGPELCLMDIAALRKDIAMCYNGEIYDDGT